MSEVAEFKISTRRTGTHRIIRVKVYDELTRLRRDADKWAGSSGRFVGAAGVTHTYQRFHVDETGQEAESPQSAILRLHSEHIGMGLLTHEVGHLAVSLFEMDRPGDLNIWGDMAKQEEFCYLLGELAAKIGIKLHQLGFYKDVRNDTQS